MTDPSGSYREDEGPAATAERHELRPLTALALSHDFEIIGDPGALFAALAKAQGVFGEVRRTATVKITTKTGGSYEFSYAPLEDILAATRPALAANELCLMQPLSGGKGSYTLRSILAHSSGAMLVMTIALPSNGQDIKELGSAITYLRRYTVQALLSVAADEDDDGSAANGDGYERQPKRGPAAGKPPANGKPQPTATDGDLQTMLDSMARAPSTTALDAIVKASAARAWNQPQKNELNRAYNARKRELTSVTNDAQEPQS